MSVRWGIAGPGRIAEKVAADFALVEDAELVAVGSRSTERARDFADRHGIADAYGSYAGLLDSGLDALYIATPHPQHRSLAIAALRAGTGVLVEKAFTATAAGAREVAEVARAESRFAMEAMWTRFLPAVRQVADWLADGAVGEIRAVQADLGVVRPVDPADRLWNPDLGGGALLDLGVYVASFAQWVLGTPEAVRAHGAIGPTGVEQDASMLLAFADGATALLTTSLHSPMPGQARIMGTQGWIDVLPRFHHPDTVVLHRSGAEPVTVTQPPVGGGYSHEIAEVTAGISAGRVESDIMPLADTITVLEILESAGHQIGVEFHEAD